MPRFGVSQCSAIGVVATALIYHAMGSALSHPGADDTVRQSTTCEPGEHRVDSAHSARTGAGQIDAVLIESRTRNPITGGKIVLTGHDTCGDAIHRHLSTGSTGEASFRGLQPGRYQVTAYSSRTATRPITTADVELSTPSRKTLRFTVTDG